LTVDADTLLDTLTVYEMMLYTAELKLPESMPLAEKKSRVDNMISQLQLTKCRDVCIGSALTRGISGGQVSSGLSAAVAAANCMCGGS
jgi:ATP-binding cassette, subfamily G (WHITE), member 2